MARHEGWITVKALRNPASSISIKAEHFELQSVIYKLEKCVSLITCYIGDSEGQMSNLNNASLYLIFT